MRGVVKNSERVDPQIAFAQFGSGDYLLLTPTLTYLLCVVRAAAGRFAREV